MATNTVPSGWKVTKQIAPSKRELSVSIHFKYIDVKKIESLSPKERIKATDLHYSQQLKQFLATHSFAKYTLLGNVKRPFGIETTIYLSQLGTIKKAATVLILQMQGAKKIAAKVKPRFFCVKMTVSIEVEGITRGMQHWEERYVLIKARSFGDAYKKTERHAKDYATPHLNKDGRFVRWRIESYDDCFDTDIMSAKEMNRPDGMEVYSVLKTRKITKERSWIRKKT